MAIAVPHGWLSKVATVYVPVIYGRIIDALAPKDAAAVAFIVPVALIMAYGAAAHRRRPAAGFGELRDAVFAAVQQRAVRLLALRTFRHLHRLSLRFHLDRQTGGLSRAIARGTEAIEQVLRMAVFNILPTLFEVLLVTLILWRLFDWRFAALTFVAVGLYIGFTVAFTNWRVKFRRRMNESDSEAQSKAVDSLLNYETVKYFGNEAHEAQPLRSQALARYERAARRAQPGLAEHAEPGDKPRSSRHWSRADHAACRAWRAGGRTDGWQVRAGQHLPDATLPAAEFSRLRLPRDQTGAGRHGADVPPAVACRAREVADRPDAPAL